ncbi:MAG: ScpA family protein [Rhizobiaceae bacterium]
MNATRRTKDRGSAPLEDMWDEATERSLSDPALVIDVDGFEGPLDLLLHLARNQKVDMARISVLKLAEQYLVFINNAVALRLELAGDYLVMAAWLAFLKSKLLIPKSASDDGESGEELAAVLQFRLKRLEAMREAAARLVNRNRLGRDVFVRGDPQLVMVDRQNEWSATLYDLLTAYASQRQRQAVSRVSIGLRSVWSLKHARQILTRLIGEIRDWTALDHYLIAFIPDPKERATALASSFAASLELVREGQLEVRQEAAFQPLYLRTKAGRPPLEAY